MVGYSVILFTAIIGGFALYWDYNNKPKIIVRLLSVLFMFGVIASFVDRCNSIKESDESKDKIDSILIQNNLLRDKYDSLSEITIKNVIGVGYSIFTLRSGFEPNEYVGMIINDNEYPSYNIEIQVIHVNGLKKCLRKMEGNKIYLDAICYSDNTRTFNVDEVRPKSSKYINELRITSGDKFIYLEIMYKSRSANILQQAVIQLGKGLCQSSYRIWEFEPSKHWNQEGLDKLIFTHNGIDNFKPDWELEFPIPVPNRILRTY